MKFMKFIGPPKKRSPKHTIIKLSKIKERILKVAAEKKLITYEGTLPP